MKRAIFYLIFSFGLIPVLSVPAGGLQEKLDQKRAGSKADAKTKKIMSSAIDDLRKKKLEKRSPKKGEDFENFSLKNQEEKTVSLEEVLKKGPVIVTFYRGSWCPYCNIQLLEYQKHLSEWEKMKATVVAISPEQIEISKEFKKEKGFEFDLLFDENNQFAKKIGIAFGLPGDLKEVYKKFGIDLEKSQKNQNWELPVSATYVLNQKGKVIYSFFDADYTKRAEPKEITKALQFHR